MEFNLFGSVRAGVGAAGVAADDAVFVRAPGCCSPRGSTIAAARRAGCPRHHWAKQRQPPVRLPSLLASGEMQLDLYQKVGRL